MSVHELALQRNKYKHLSDDEWRWFLQQVEGRERTADKLPTFASIEDWWYPVRLSCEQCSSELTAKYKASIITANSQAPIASSSFLDLTGGYGVDTLFLSALFDHTDYVEQNAELCRIMAHNKDIKNDKLKVQDISIHNCTAEEFLTNCQEPTANRQYALIFIDPARRDEHGGKVFRLADCTPNVVELLPTIAKHLAPDGRILLKLSPMLDISQALKELSTPRLTDNSPLSWAVYVVAVKNEVKELLLLSSPYSVGIQEESITAIDLVEPQKAFTFTRKEESDCKAPDDNSQPSVYLYEPSVAILKAGAYKLVAKRFGLAKLDVNTHLYTSDHLIPGFPGRIWRIVQVLNDKKSVQMVHDRKANVVVRNYPLTADQVRKKLHLQDGGEDFIIACRVNSKPTLFHAERV